MDQDPEVHDYTVESTSNLSARVQDIPLGESPNGQTRKVVRAVIVENTRNADCTVKIAIVHQRRSQTTEWQDMEGVPLSQLHAGETAKMALNTDETKALLERLQDLYRIGARGVQRGVRVLTLANEDAVISTEEGKARLLRKIAQSENLESLARVDEEFGGSASELFAVGRLHKSRAKVLDEFEERLTQNHDENDWKRYLKQHSWIFGVSNIEVIQESRLGIHHDTDIPLEVEGGFMDIAELKRPDDQFWRTNPDGSLFLYRDKFPVQTQKVTEALAQVAGYIFEAEKNAADVDFIRDHGGRVPLKPRGILIIGRSVGWGEEEWRAHRLLNDKLHGIQVITYDQLLERAKRAQELLTS